MSARSTGWAAVTVTVPLARSTVTYSTPSTALISAVTARWQCAHVMPVTVNVVEPMKVCGVLDSMGTPRGCWWWCGREEESARGWGRLSGEAAGTSPVGARQLPRAAPGAGAAPPAAAELRTPGEPPG